MTRDAFALTLAALLAGFSSACSTQLAPEIEEEEVVRPPPALLTFVSPSGGQVLGDADDVAPQEPGLQVEIVIAVADLENGLSLEDISLQLDGEDEPRRVAVSENGSGRYAVLQRVTLRAPNSAASADGDTPGLLTRRLSAWVQLEEEDTPRGEATIELQMLVPDDNRCPSHLTLGGDLRIESPADLPQNAACLTINGDLIITSSSLVDVTAIESIVEIGGDLVVANNASLLDLDAWTRLQRVGGDVFITGNPSLPTGDAERLLERVGAENIGGDITIEDNAD